MNMLLLYINSISNYSSCDEVITVHIQNCQLITNTYRNKTDMKLTTT